MGNNTAGLKRGFHYNPDNDSLEIYFDGDKVAQYGKLIANTYYVNNITGSSTGDGLTWNSAVSEVSEAIALVVAYQATMDAGNEYVRNNIIIQGTSTAYTALTSLAGYTNYIGIGADPTGNGAGIARFDGAGAADACDTSSTTVRGFDLYNLQFTQSASGASYGLDIAGAAYRSKIEHCGFTNNTTAGIHIKSGGSLIIDDCHTDQDQFNSTYGMLIGSTSAATGTFNSCKITNSFFHGTTAAVLLYNNACSNTYFRNCVFDGGTHGFQDLGNDANGSAFYVHLVDCYGFGTHSTTVNTSGIECTNNYTKKAIGCWENAGGAAFNYPDPPDA